MLASLVVVLAFLLLAWEASSRPRRPLLAVLGLVLVAVAAVLRFGAEATLIDSAIGFLRSLSVGLLVGGVVMGLRHPRARGRHAAPFLALALVAFLGSLAFSALRPSTEVVPTGTLAPQQAALLVELGPDDEISELTPLLTQYEATAERAFPSVALTDDADLAQVYLIAAPAEQLDALRARLHADTENVDATAWNQRLQLLDPLPNPETGAVLNVEARANDPYAAEQWALEAIGGHAVHAMLQGLTPVRKARVAILDTGVDAAHPDLAAAFGESPGRTDPQGHGTHCAGLAAAVANNGTGIASLNWEGRFIELLSFQAIHAFGGGTIEQIAQAVIDASQAEADVISMSLGDYVNTPPKVLTDAVAYAQRRGSIIVASAGNDRMDARTHIPSNLDGVIAVAALDANLRRARFSNSTTSLERPLSAPGVDVLSLTPGGTYRRMSGTSMATPLVAGLLGVLRALDPALSADDAYALLAATGQATADEAAVGPFLDAEAAVQALLEPVPAQAP
ncbi:MAG: S8 family serine peptidase [Bacteroidota bacterium]